MDVRELTNIGSQIWTVAKDIIPDVVAALITTVFLKDGTNVKEYRRKLIDRKFVEVAEELLNQGHLTYVEFYKCRNFMKIAKLADEAKREHKQQEAHHDTSFDFDWFVRFFEASGNISNEQMQELWARILAGEVERPGTFSLRTIETLNHMTYKEASAFSDIANLAMHTADGMWFVVADGASAFDLDEVLDLVIPNNKIRLLQECGLVNPIKDDMIVWYSTNKVKNPIDLNDNFIIANERIVLLFEANDVIKRTQMKIKKQRSVFFPYYPLTEAGRQLLAIVKNDSEYDPILDLGKAINRHGKSSTREVTAHEIKGIEDYMIYFDEYDLLQ